VVAEIPDELGDEEEPANRFDGDDSGGGVLDGRQWL
jgi:hypothetical protein